MAVNEEMLFNLVDAIKHRDKMELIRSFVAKYFAGLGIVAVEMGSESCYDDEGGSYRIVNSVTGYTADGKSHDEPTAPPADYVAEHIAEWDGMNPNDWQRMNYANGECYAQDAWESELYDLMCELPADLAWRRIDLTDQSSQVDLSRYTLLLDGQPVKE